VPGPTPSGHSSASSSKLNLQFVLAYTAEEVAVGLHYIAKGMIDLAPLITRQIRPESAPDAFAALVSPTRREADLPGGRPRGEAGISAMARL
jgi:threonine dehydrogenase-like Zn-dependent dehydrogenase